MIGKTDQRQRTAVLAHPFCTHVRMRPRGDLGARHVIDFFRLEWDGQLALFLRARQQSCQQVDDGRVAASSAMLGHGRR